MVEPEAKPSGYYADDTPSKYVDTGMMKVGITAGAYEERDSDRYEDDRHHP